ncbi:MAG: hypothetical protein IPF75_05400 [Bacteroidetes bacterium]|nr:hypothetical protein [Bacteroidota bacterium]
MSMQDQTITESGNNIPDAENKIRCADSPNAGKIIPKLRPTLFGKTKRDKYWSKDLFNCKVSRTGYDFVFTDHLQSPGCNGKMRVSRLQSCILTILNVKIIFPNLFFTTSP